MLVAEVVMFSLLLSVSAIGITAGAKQSNTPTLEKITFVHYLSQEHSKPVWDDTVTDYRLIAGG
ncbi:MAG: hypothetical protein ACUVQ8_07835 [Nitrososphaeria archaeon]